MPYGDGTGPRGEGPGTGRRFGYCAGYSRPGYAAPGAGRGYGYGGRWGARTLGWRRGWRGAGVIPGAAPVAPADEVSDLKAQADELRAALDAIQNRLNALEK